MFRSQQVLRVALATLASTLIVTTAASAQGNAPARHDMRRLGGATAFNRPPLTHFADLKAMAERPRIAADLRKVLDEAGLGNLGDAVVSSLSSATTSVVGSLCADATPADGVIVECTVPRGGTLEWMAYRPKGGTSVGIKRDLNWAGPKPFRAYLFNVTSNDRVYTFVVPEACGNLSLMTVRDVPRAAPVIAAPPASRPEPAAPAPPPPAPPAAMPVQAPAPVPPAVEAPLASVKRSPSFFVDGLFGKDRRERPIEGTDLEFGQCTPLFGAKVGIAKKIANNWEMAAAAGVAVALVDGDEKLKQNEVFIDVEANKYLANGVMLGTGLSLWDVTHSETFAPAVLLHAGVPLGKTPVMLLVEGRLFVQELDSLDNNYQFWGGVRIHFGK